MRKTQPLSILANIAPLMAVCLGFLFLFSYTDPGLAWWAQTDPIIGFTAMKVGLFVLICGLVMFTVCYYTDFLSFLDSLSGYGFVVACVPFMMACVVFSNDASSNSKDIGLSALSRAAATGRVLDVAQANAPDPKRASRDPTTLFVRHLLATPTHASLYRAHAVVNAGEHDARLATLLASASLLGLAESAPAKAARARGWATRAEANALRDLAYAAGSRSSLKDAPSAQQNAFFKLTGQSDLGQPLDASSPVLAAARP